MSNPSPTTTLEEKSSAIVAVQPIVGRLDRRLDPKRRFTIPSDWYERMGCPEQVYAMPNLSKLRCIDIFSPIEFDKKMEPFRNAALSNVAVAQFLSRLGEMINCLSVDKQNRIQMNDSFLSYAEIETDDIALIGSGFNFGIWSFKNKPKVNQFEVDEIAQLAEEAAKMNF